MATAMKIVPPGDNVSDFISRTHKMLINGKWVEAASGKTFPTFDPATGEVLSQVAEGDREDIDRAVKAARVAFETGPWSKMTASERGRAIWKLGDLLDQRRDEFAEIESLDNGKPYKVARAADVPLAAELFRYMAGWATKIEGNTIPLSVPYTPGAKYLAYTLREPVGVVGQIIPWNFPLLMAAWKLGPALAAGCTIVMKPAEQTPLSVLAPRRIDSWKPAFPTESSMSSRAMAKLPELRWPRILTSIRWPSLAPPKWASSSCMRPRVI